MAMLGKPHAGHSWSKPTWGMGVCALRLMYTPRVRSPGNSARNENPGLVSRMLEELEPLMKGHTPNQTICQAMFKKIEAEEVLSQAIAHVVKPESIPTKGYSKSKVDKCSGKPNSFKPQLGHGSGGRDGLDGSLRKGDGAVTYKPTYHTITHKMAAKVMLMASTLMTSLNIGAMNLAMDGVDGLWEVACSPHSWLSEACEKQGLQPKRINLHQGYDLYQPKTWELLQTERRQRRPRKIWFSLPCTKWCPWNRLNYANRKEELAAYQRRERKMLRNARNFIIEALLDDPTIQIYWEWPVNCDGWKQEPVIDISPFLDEHFIPWKPCRIDGCVYGMKPRTTRISSASSGKS